LFVASVLVLWRTEITSFIEDNTQLSSPIAQSRTRDIAALARGDINTGALDYAGRERAGVIYEFTDLIAQSPIVGYGTNFSYGQPVGPHNIYLTQWADNGILGLAFLLIFLLSSFWYFKKYRDIRGMVYVAAFSISGVFSHTHLDARPLLILFGLLGALAYVEYLRPIVLRSSVPKPVVLRPSVPEVGRR
jgi:hypothetical protein